MSSHWQNWLILVLGIWVIVSPYVADSLIIGTTFGNLVSGAIIAVVALWNIFGNKK